MVQSRGRPAPSEWNSIRDEFTYKYRDLNMTLNAIKEEFAERGFVATDRQYKTRVHAWGLDIKNTKRSTYHAMYVVMRNRQRLGLSSVFLVPRGPRMKVTRSDQIMKEVNRNRSVSDPSNLRRAEAILVEERVMVFAEGDPGIHRYIQPHQWTDASGLPLAESQPGGQPSGSRSIYADPNQGESTSPYFVNTAYSTTSGPEHRSEYNDPSLEAKSTSTSVTPSTWQSPSSDFARGSVLSGASTSRIDPLVTAQALHIKDEELDLITNSLFSDPSCVNQAQITTPNHSATGRNESALRQMEAEKQLTLQWATPYLRSFLNRHNPQIKADQAGRDHAKAAFKDMLQRSNRYIFPYCNWMTTVLASNNQFELLTGFLTDCCEVIDQDSISYELTYGSPLHLTWALYNGNPQEIEAHRTKFLSSNNAIRIIWGEDSPNYLINQYHHAWLMLERNQHPVALQILRQCLPISERVMGFKHLVTVNCLAILARALSEMGHDDDALATFEDVLKRLADCASPLQAYRHRALMRLVELQVKKGNVVEAEKNLKTTLAFRSGHFGMESPVTWDAIHKLVDLLTRQGRTEEASQVLAQNTARHDRESAEAWFNRHQTPAPWLSQT